MTAKPASNRTGILIAIAALVSSLVSGLSAQDKNTSLSEASIQDIVKRSYPYVAMYNVNNKFAAKQGGWNTVVADTALKDHTMTEIARPNNDTLYISCLLDLRKDPVILDMPAFDSKYVSLMVTGYDHYVNIPMSTRLGDFKKPEHLLLYSARTEGYDGVKPSGVERVFETTGDFVSAVLRIMPHADDEARFARIVQQMRGVKAITLSEFRGGKAKPTDDIAFPRVGKTDADLFGSNLLEVMQFVFNHTTFDSENKLDSAILAAYKPLGVVPGRVFDPARAARIDAAKFRTTAEQLAAGVLGQVASAAGMEDLLNLFQPKGRMTVDSLFLQSVIGPIGMPAAEAVYPPITTKDGKSMNATSDYVLHMAKEDLPPAQAFWSVTLYDMKNGFFIPNDRKKYSVGENAGMKLNENGGIDICVAATQPQGVPAENWLPIQRKDEPIGLIMRIYVPDLDKLKTWKVPKVERLARQ